MEWYKEGTKKWDEKLTPNEYEKKLLEKIDEIEAKVIHYNEYIHNYLKRIKRKLREIKATFIEKQLLLKYAIGVLKIMYKYDWLVDRKRELQVLKEKFRRWGLKDELMYEIDKILIWNRRIKPIGLLTGALFDKSEFDHSSFW